MNLRHWLRTRGNPHNLTRIHLARLSARHGFEIGDWTYGRPKVRFAESGARLVIGRYGSIADQVEILLGGNHRADFAPPIPSAPRRWRASGPKLLLPRLPRHARRCGKSATKSGSAPAR